jgi:hypothetical protein
MELGSKQAHDTSCCCSPATNELQLQQLCDENPSFSELQ